MIRAVYFGLFFFQLNIEFSNFLCTRNTRRQAKLFMCVTSLKVCNSHSQAESKSAPFNKFKETVLGLYFVHSFFLSNKYTFRRMEASSPRTLGTKRLDETERQLLHLLSKDHLRPRKEPLHVLFKHPTIISRCASCKPQL